MVCSYQQSWEKERSWIKKDKGDKFKAWCNSCLKSFSIREGSTAVRKHEKGQKHVENTSLVLSSKTNNNGQRSIENALSRAESISIQQRKIKDQAHIAEAMLVSCFSRHSLPESMYDCFNV